jgi:hypothetical protein
MSAPARVCRHGEIVPAGGSCPRCREDERERDRRHAAKLTAYGYSSSHWQELRRLRLEADAHLCRLRLPGCTLRATHVHLHPELGGDHTVATLGDCVSACAQCSGAVDAPRARHPRGHGMESKRRERAPYPAPARRTL